MRKYLIGFIIGVVITVPVTALSQTAVDNIQAYLNPNVKITVDGEPLELENTPIIYEQTTYLPLREISEKVMGMSVGWNQETSTVELTTEEAWPTTDVTEFQSFEIEGEEMKTKENVSFHPKYLNLFNKDETLSIDDIDENIRSANIYLRQYKNIVSKAEKYPENYKDYIVEAYREEIPKIEDIISYWTSLKKQKEEEKSE